MRLYLSNDHIVVRPGEGLIRAAKLHADINNAGVHPASTNISYMTQLWNGKKWLSLLATKLDIDWLDSALGKAEFYRWYYMAGHIRVPGYEPPTHEEVLKGLEGIAITPPQPTTDIEVDLNES